MGIEWDSSGYLNVASVRQNSAGDGDTLVFVFNIRDEFESAPHPNEIDRLWDLFDNLHNEREGVHGFCVVRVKSEDLP